MHILYTQEGHDGRAKGKIANHPYSKFETSERWYDTFCESMKERKEHKYICFAKGCNPTTHASQILASGPRFRMANLCEFQLDPACGSVDDGILLADRAE